MQNVLDFLSANPWSGYLALGLISLVLARKSQFDEWAESNPRIAGVMKLLRSLGIDPWMLLQSLSLIVRGRLPEQKAASKPKDPPKSDPPRSTPIPPIIAMLSLGLLGCSAPQEKSPCSPADYAALSATCGNDEAECERVIDEREKLCADRIRGDQ